MKMRANQSDLLSKNADYFINLSQLSDQQLKRISVIAKVTMALRYNSLVIVDIQTEIIICITALSKYWILKYYFIGKHLLSTFTFVLIVNPWSQKK